MQATKYHRTYHLPWSEGITSDDKVVPDDSHFIGKAVVVTEKMDGENTSMYRDKIHARSIDSRNHPSRTWVKNFWFTISHCIPEDVVIRGENLYAKHSIHYLELPSYFMGFAVEKNGIVLAWDDTVDYFDDVGIVPVPTLYVGEYDRKLIHNLVMDRFKEDGGLDNHEGYVIRLAGGYKVEDSKFSINKWVRKNHVQTNNHWMNSKIVKNELMRNYHGKRKYFTDSYPCD